MKNITKNQWYTIFAIVSVVVLLLPMFLYFNTLSLSIEKSSLKFISLMILGISGGIAGKFVLKGIKLLQKSIHQSKYLGTISNAMLLTSVASTITLFSIFNNSPQATTSANNNINNTSIENSSKIDVINNEDNNLIATNTNTKAAVNINDQNATETNTNNSINNNSTEIHNKKIYNENTNITNQKINSDSNNCKKFTLKHDGSNMDTKVGYSIYSTVRTIKVFNSCGYFVRNGKLSLKRGFKTVDIKTFNGSTLSMGAYQDIMIGDMVVLEFSEMQKMVNGKLEVSKIAPVYIQFPINDNVPNADPKVKGPTEVEIEMNKYAR